MYIVMRPDELQHHGVKGMRWGVRKDRGSSGSSIGAKVAKGIKSASSSKRVRSARNTYRNLTGSRKSAALKKYRSKNIDGMSDKDLQKAVNRMNLERQYRQLTRVDFYRGKRAVDTMYNNTTAMSRTASSAKKAKKVAFTYGAKKAAQIAAL